jgi:hypothetical protein
MKNLLRIYPGETYPAQWEAGLIQWEINSLANWQCEHCGMLFPRGDTRAITARNRNGQPVVLTVHHLNGQKNDCRWQNLLACCQGCHLHIQASWEPGGSLPLSWGAIAPPWLLARGLEYTIAQPALF